MSTRQPPLKIPAYAAGSFALFTLQQRLPKILAQAKAELRQESQDDARWGALESGLASGGAIEGDLFALDTPFWRSTSASLAGHTWSELPFFDLEFLFYHAINSIAASVQPGLDVFARTRHTALVDALPGVELTLAAGGTSRIDVALELALSGNHADLSQLAHLTTTTAPASAATTAQQSKSRLVDERSALQERLAQEQDGTVQVLADNAGSELCFDLNLVDALLTLRRGPVVLQLKPKPMFVSDALVSDVEQTIDRFIQRGVGSRLVALGIRLRQALDSGRLSLSAPPDWAEPRHMNALSPELTAALQAATLVIAKGDLNYRRFFEDRAWPADTKVDAASVGTSMHAFSLRVLKSDTIVGLDAADVSRLFATEPDWRSNGAHSLVQRVDSLAPDR
jgi:hypothetical protein